MSGHILTGHAVANPFRFTHPSDRHQGEDYIYVLSLESGAVKVGYTSNPAERITGLIAVARANADEVTAVWISEPHLNARDSERELLDYCRRTATKALGEYFLGLNFADVAAAAEMSGSRERWTPGADTTLYLAPGGARKLRAAKGFTLRGLAKRAQISPGFLSKIERGVVGASPETVARLSVALDVPMGALLTGDGYEADFAEAMAQARRARPSVLAST